MERLTFLNGDYFWCVSNDNCFEEQSEHYCGPAIDRLAAYEATGLEPEEVAKFAKYERETKLLIKDLNDLMAYRMAEQEGRLLVLPCKVGDTVFFIDFCTTAEDFGTRYVSFSEVVRVSIDNSFVVLKNHLALPFERVFLTREEAEAALKGAVNG